MTIYQSRLHAQCIVEQCIWHMLLMCDIGYGHPGLDDMHIAFVQQLLALLNCLDCAIGLMHNENECNKQDQQADGNDDDAQLYPGFLIM